MMRCAFLVACLLLVGSPAAFAATPLQDLFQLNFFFAKVKDIVHLNLKADADPVRCLNDTSELASPRFAQCQTVFTDDPTHTSTEEARRFCQSHCPMYLSQLLHRLAADCQLPADQLPGPSLFVLLQQSCDIYNGSDRHMFCIETWGDLDPSSVSFSQDYATCLTTFDGQGACPNVCKSAEHWVASTFGCCYKGLEQYVAAEGETEGFLTDDYWNACGIKEPPLCISPRG